MNEVRVFDGKGNLKHIVSEKELIAISDKQFEKKKRGAIYSGLYRKNQKKECQK